MLSIGLTQNCKISLDVDSKSNKHMYISGHYTPTSNNCYGNTYFCHVRVVLMSMRHTLISVMQLLDARTTLQKSDRINKLRYRIKIVFER